MKRLPSTGCNKPIIISTSVLLPAPDPPIMPTVSPFLIEKFMFVKLNVMYQFYNQKKYFQVLSHC